MTGSGRDTEMRPHGLRDHEVLYWFGWGVVQRDTPHAEGPCWEWSGRVDDRGYGVVKVKRKAWKAHRLAYTVWVSEIPEGLVVRHKCDNLPCVNPKHLELGTQAENVRDMILRGRDYRGEPRKTNAILSEDDVRNIRVRYEKGESCSHIAEDYPVTKSNVWSVATRKTWRDVL